MITKIYLNTHTAQIKGHAVIITTEDKIDSGELMDMTGGTIIVTGCDNINNNKCEFVIPKNQIILISRNPDNN